MRADIEDVNQYIMYLQSKLKEANDKLEAIENIAKGE